MNAQQVLKQYLLLIRLPNVFTAFGDIFVGYVSVVALTQINPLNLSMLVGASGLLYISGIVFNDYFDVSVDLIERPSRPLPSGKISMRSALLLAVSTMLVANAMAGIVGPMSLLVSSILSTVIIAYDAGAKLTRFGPLAMSAARFLNVLLGASAAGIGFVYPGLTNDYRAYQSGSFGPPWTALVPASLMMAYVYSITILSRVEVVVAPDKQTAESANSTRKAARMSFTIILCIITAMIVFSIYDARPLMLVNVGIFCVVLGIIWKKNGIWPISGLPLNPKRIQGVIKRLVLSIIIIDSAFIAAHAGLLYGLALLSLLIPPILLSRRFYVT